MEADLNSVHFVSKRVGFKIITMIWEHVTGEKSVISQSFTDQIHQKYMI